MSSNLGFNFTSEYNDIVDDEHYQYPPRKIQERRVRLYWDLTLLWRRSLSYRNQSIDLLCKSIDWFLYDNSLLPKRVNNEQDNQTKSVKV